MSNPKINKLVIKNFGCIGAQGVSVDIDRIVVLVGANNSGKSTILRAFEVVSDCLKLEQEDFFNRQILPGALPEIELHSIVVAENKPGDEWCDLVQAGTWLVKERWTWGGVNVEPRRFGFNVKEKRWALSTDTEQMPWGVNNVAKSRRPKPHRVSTFDSPESQSKATTSLLKSLLEVNIKNLKANDADPSSRYDEIVDSLRSLRDDSKQIQQTSITDIETKANLILEQIFPNCHLKVVAPQSVAPISIDLLGDEFGLEMGVNGGPSFPLERQGSGTQRTALWTILKLLADMGIKAKVAGKTAKTFHENVGPNTSHILLSLKSAFILVL